MAVDPERTPELVSMNPAQGVAFLKQRGDNWRASAEALNENLKTALDELARLRSEVERLRGEWERLRMAVELAAQENWDCDGFTAACRKCIARAALSPREPAPTQETPRDE